LCLAVLNTIEKYFKEKMPFGELLLKNFYDFLLLWVMFKKELFFLNGCSKKRENF